MAYHGMSCGISLNINEYHRISMNLIGYQRISYGISLNIMEYQWISQNIGDVANYISYLYMSLYMDDDDGWWWMRMINDFQNQGIHNFLNTMWIAENQFSGSVLGECSRWVFSGSKIGECSRGVFSGSILGEWLWIAENQFSHH